MIEHITTYYLSRNLRLVLVGARSGTEYVVTRNGAALAFITAPPEDMAGGGKVDLEAATRTGVPAKAPPPPIPPSKTTKWLAPAASTVKVDPEALKAAIAKQKADLEDFNRRHKGNRYQKRSEIKNEKYATIPAAKEETAPPINPVLDFKDRAEKCFKCKRFTVNYVLRLGKRVPIHEECLIKLRV